MIIWIDALFAPAIAEWIESNFPFKAIALRELALRELGLRDADDDEIFVAARRVEAVVMTKDADFLSLLDRLGPPPQLIWITCGNTSNRRLKEILSSSLHDAVDLLVSGEPFVEIAG